RLHKQRVLARRASGVSGERRPAKAGQAAAMPATTDKAESEAELAGATPRTGARPQQGARKRPGAGAKPGGGAKPGARSGGRKR
ncbi:MAG TPA: protein translocase subunit SecF, partial [Micromonosporaceae bacterium]